MATIILENKIDAPAERVFDLSRSIDLHLRSADHTNESAIGGRTHGLIELGESVTFRARHFAIWFEITSKIVAFDRPDHFCDVMVHGPFKSFEHDHLFESTGDKTIMIDKFTFQSPFGVLGEIVNTIFLANYMRRFLERRNETLKAIAESNKWQKYLE